MFNPWINVTWRFARLGLEAQNVIALRLMRFARGGNAGKTEVRRMVNEKISALGEVAMAVASTAATGKTGSSAAHRVLRVYRKRTRANKRRLSREKR